MREPAACSREQRHIAAPTTPNPRVPPIDWEEVARWLLQIASMYGLNPEEFCYYCTIPRPNGDSESEWVFYPYHVLSRPQGEALLWDWPILFAVARTMLETMRRHCNKHAEAAGYGEKMSPLLPTYLLVGTSSLQEDPICQVPAATSNTGRGCFSSS